MVTYTSTTLKGPIAHWHTRHLTSLKSCMKLRKARWDRIDAGFNTNSFPLFDSQFHVFHYCRDNKTRKTQNTRKPDRIRLSGIRQPPECWTVYKNCSILRGLVICKGRLKSIFLFLVQKAPQLIKQGRSAQCQLPVLGQYSTQADRSDSVPHSGNALHFPM